MLIILWMQALLAAAPVAYAWWSSRAIARSLDDPTLPDLLLARQRRVAQVALVVIIALVMQSAPAGFSVAVVLGVLVAHYPVRRTVYGDTWSLWQYLRFTTFSAIAFAGLWLFPLIASVIVVKITRAWIPEPSTQQTGLGLALGIVAAVVYLIWHRHFVPVWLALHQATPLDANANGSLLARFAAVLDRAGSRLDGRPTIHRYGAVGGQVVNAAALCSLPARAVAMSDALLVRLDEPEAAAIFAHEIAHHEHYDTALLRKRRRWSYGLAILMVVIPALQLMSGGQYSLAIDLIFLVAILVLFARGQRGHREHETACDLRAVDLTGDPDAVIRALTKIHALARMPRRFSQEYERAATHPSLARRIQAIRAHATVDAAPLATPTIVATTTPGAYVAFDDARSHWFLGVPADMPLDVAALRERATTYRALAYGELAELRLETTKPRMLRATDIGGRSWSVGIRDDDVSLVQTALDAVDTRFGTAPPQPAGSSDHAARTLASALLVATMLAGLWGLPMLVTAVNAFAPTTASMAAMAVMTIGQVALVLVAEPDGASAAIDLIAGDAGAPYAALALGAAALLAIWSAWIAWRWIRTPPSGMSPNATKWSRTVFAVLAVAVITSGLRLVAGGVSSPSELVGNPGTAPVAVALLGLGAALLALRGRAQRRLGAGIALAGLVSFAAGIVGERFDSSSSAIAWTTARLSLVATVPMGRVAHDVELSPAGTRFLTRRYDEGEEDNDGDESMQLVTGSIPLLGPTRTVKAIDAALPNEAELLVLDRNADDSLELRLERHDADSASRVVWRRTLPSLMQPHLELRAHGARWIVSGRRFDRRRLGPFVTIAGAADGSAMQVAEVPGDSLYAQTLYSFGDGTTLAAAVAPVPPYAGTRRSVLRTYLSAMWGNGPQWTIFRYQRDGSRRVGSMGGYPMCAGTADGDAAVCVERRLRKTRLWSIARSGDPVDLGILSANYVRASASPGGHVVASSNSGRAVAIVDVARRRGVRTSLPRGDYDFVNELTVTSSGVVAVLGGQQGMRIAVYRLEPDSAGRTMVAR
ncbi:MAG TPA: M48 family metallopeptidase [Gemmatimonadaceae bacterium]|nr:M48 family metallopeptidase [Gemmatimonadaceae bacterium]